MTSGTTYRAVRRAGEAEQTTVLDVLTEAFMRDPVIGWLFPDEDDRRRLQPFFYGPMLTHPDAEAYLIGDSDRGPGAGPAGASIWLSLAAGQAPYDGQPDGTDPDLAAVFGDSGARLWALGQRLAGRHPSDTAHLYLPCMGVVPGRQGGGLGSELLRYRLDRADAAGLGAYLEATSAGSRALYLRYGFVDLGEPVRLPGDGPSLWPMWRAGRPA
jgi:GNAT superfamily N-acetyltransferase